MKIRASSNQSKKKFEMPEVKAGSYFGRIVQLINLGVQKQTDWKTGEDKKPAEKLMLTVEIPKLTWENEKKEKVPRWFYKEFVVSTNEKSNMRAVFDSILEYSEDDWQNGDVDVADALGYPVVVQIGHTSTGNPKILNIGPAPEEMPVPDPKFGVTEFDFYHPDLNVFNNLQPWMQDKIKSAVDYKGSKLEALVETEKLNDDIPF